MFNSLAPILLALLSAVAVGAIALVITRSLGGAVGRQAVAAMPKYSTRPHGGDGEVAMAPAEDGSLFLKIGRRLLTPRYERWLIEKLESAGQFGALALSTVLTKKITFAVVGIMFGLLFVSKGLAAGLAAMALFAVLGFLVPDLLLISDGQKRDQEMERGLPDAIDLLNLCVESGLSFEAAIARVSVSMNGPVAEEFGALVSQIQLGKSRVEGMSALAERTKSKGLQRFVSALLQVDQLGMPISGVLAEQAQEMRAIRKDRAREQGQKVTIKILMPLMLCFLPAMFIIVLGPAVVQLATAMGQL
jgi:tight adherence protein C